MLKCQSIHRWDPFNPKKKLMKFGLSMQISISEKGDQAGIWIIHISD